MAAQTTGTQTAIYSTSFMNTMYDLTTGCGPPRRQPEGHPGAAGGPGEGIRRGAGAAPRARGCRQPAGPRSACRRSVTSRCRGDSGCNDGARRRHSCACRQARHGRAERWCRWRRCRGAGRTRGRAAAAAGGQRRWCRLLEAAVRVEEPRRAAGSVHLHSPTFGRVGSSILLQNEDCVSFQMAANGSENAHCEPLPGTKACKTSLSESVKA